MSLENSTRLDAASSETQNLKAALVRRRLEQCEEGALRIFNHSESAFLFDISWWNHHIAFGLLYLRNRGVNFLGQKIRQPMRMHSFGNVRGWNPTDEFALVFDVKILGVKFTQLEFPTKK